MRIQINELRIQWKKLEKELQSKFLEIQKKELNTNSKISEWENRAGGGGKYTTFRKQNTIQSQVGKSLKHLNNRNIYRWNDKISGVCFKIINYGNELWE